MKFLNCSNNTIFIADINKNVPYKGEVVQDISLDEVKKSSHFRLLLSLGQLKIVECGDSLFERNLLKIQKTARSIEKKENFGVEMEDNSNQIEVKIRGHFYEAGGYAKVNRNLAFGLNKMGVRTSIEATNKLNNDLNESEVRSLSKINKSVSRKAIVIDSMIPTFSNISAGRYRILYTTVEAGSVPTQFIETAMTYDEVWVTSDFCKSVLEKSGVTKPITVIPDSINTELYKEDGDKYEFNPSLNDFVFISVFGWSYRKGYDVLLRAYLEEFTGDDPVSLLVVSRYLCNTNRSDVIKDTLKKYISQYGKENAAHIARCSNVIPENLMPSLYRAANAFVLFSRGEGFGIPYCEASLCGLPVVSTNHSGQSMFLKKDNSTLIDIDSISPLQPGLMHVHYWDEQLFPQLTHPNTILSARKSMRWVYENYSEAKQRNEKLKNFVKDNYAIDKVAKNVHDRLAQIWSKIK